MLDAGALRNRRWLRPAVLVLVVLVATGGAGYSMGWFDRPAPPPAAAPPPVTGDPDGGTAGVQAQLVQREDNRIRAALRTGIRAPGAKPIETKGSLPTHVLIRRTAPYTVADLVKAGVLRISGGVGLLTASVFAAPGAVLTIDGRQLRTLRLTSGPGGYATLVTWSGSLRLGKGLAVTSWDPTKRAPDTAFFDGRAYIRATTGNLRIDGVHLSHLGFWSGRTGGVAWTGDDTGNATGFITDSTITGNQYGVFLARSADVKIDRVQITRSVRDGVRLHRGAARTLVAATEVAGGGGDGIVVARGVGSSILRGVTSTANGGSGLILDGRSLATSDTVSGAATTPTKGTLVDGAVITANRGVSIRVQGGVGTILRGMTVRGTDRGIVVQDNARAVSVEQSTVVGVGSAGLVLDGDDRSVVTDTVFSGWRTGVQLRGSRQPVLRRVDVNGAALFGLSLRGRVTSAVIDECSLSGRGPRPVDLRTLDRQAGRPLLTNTDTTGWVVAGAPKTFRQLVEQHPALWAWTLILIVPPLLWWRARARARLRPGHAHPYRETTKWSPDQAVRDTVPEIRFDGTGRGLAAVRPRRSVRRHLGLSPRPRTFRRHRVRPLLRRRPLPRSRSGLLSRRRRRLLSRWCTAPVSCSGRLLRWHRPLLERWRRSRQLRRCITLVFRRRSGPPRRSCALRWLRPWPWSSPHRQGTARVRRCSPAIPAPRHRPPRPRPGRLLPRRTRGRPRPPAPHRYRRTGPTARAAPSTRATRCRRDRPTPHRLRRPARLAPSTRAVRCRPNPGMQPAPRPGRPTTRSPGRRLPGTWAGTRCPYTPGGPDATDDLDEGFACLAVPRSVSRSWLRRRRRWASWSWSPAAPAPGATRRPADPAPRSPPVRPRRSRRPPAPPPAAPRSRPPER